MLGSFLKNLKSYIAVNFNLPFLYGKEFYSQFGEDRYLHKLFPKKHKGFYVDIGAHHPFRYSNTQYFYNNGWKGINIDANPGTKKMFDKTRKGDVNLEHFVSNSRKAKKYHIFADSAFNTSSQKRSQNVLNSGQSTLVKTVVNTKSVKLSAILDKYVVKNTPIDFLSIDTEGSELDVLKSNNWKKYHSKYIIVEIAGNSNDVV